ncbi:hypothetical protein DEO72_LG8g2127 [Vigna unguiculata]|uniref:Uncharacterized protein n=1 Tax=Vigna unguiculata TaxID=3917 RepID=A0A4D6MTJ0_VIGUN|nr:hypothetical protein DEO72_LG8g2127 [Vigna unguiculata]
MIPVSFLHCLIGVSGFFQKPPGGSSPTARRHISFYWIPCWSEIKLTSGYGKVLGCTLSQVRISLVCAGTDAPPGGKLDTYVPCSRLRDATCGEVRGWWITCARLRAGRSVEQDYERGDRVIRYTGAGVEIGGAEDVQPTE